jgi:hypothetical protein
MYRLSPRQGDPWRCGWCGAETDVSSFLRLAGTHGRETTIDRRQPRGPDRCLLAAALEDGGNLTFADTEAMQRVAHQLIGDLTLGHDHPVRAATSQVLALAF